MKQHKFSALYQEQQFMKRQKSYFTKIVELNKGLAALHEELAPQIDHASIQQATNYVNQYIAYATVWQLKFATNWQNPEVAMLQVFHLHYVFSQLAEDAFPSQRLAFTVLSQQFDHLKPYTDEQVAARRAVFLSAAQ